MIDEVEEEETVLSANKARSRGGVLCQLLGPPPLIENEDSEILDTQGPNTNLP